MLNVYIYPTDTWYVQIFQQWMQNGATKSEKKNMPTEKLCKAKWLWHLRFVALCVGFELMHVSQTQMMALHYTNT